MRSPCWRRCRGSRRSPRRRRTRRRRCRARGSARPAPRHPRCPFSSENTEPGVKPRNASSSPVANHDELHLPRRVVERRGAQARGRRRARDVLRNVHVFAEHAEAADVVVRLRRPAHPIAICERAVHRWSRADGGRRRAIAEERLLARRAIARQQRRSRRCRSNRQTCRRRRTRGHAARSCPS